MRSSRQSPFVPIAAAAERLDELAQRQVIAGDARLRSGSARGRAFRMIFAQAHHHKPRHAAVLFEIAELFEKYVHAIGVSRLLAVGQRQPEFRARMPHESGHAAFHHERAVGSAHAPAVFAIAAVAPRPANTKA